MRHGGAAGGIVCPYRAEEGCESWLWHLSNPTGDLKESAKDWPENKLHISKSMSYLPMWKVPNYVPRHRARIDCPDEGPRTKTPICAGIGIGIGKKLRPFPEFVPIW